MILRGKVTPIVPAERASWVTAPVALFLVSVSCLVAQAQQKPPASGAQTPAAAAQPGGVAGLPTQAGPFDDVLIKETDEDDVPTDLFSRVSFEYDHASFNGGADNDRFRIKGQQAFGPKYRLGFGYEIPFIDAHRNGDVRSASGLGDVKLIVSAVLGDTGKFKNAVQAEFTLPSAANEVVGFGQTIVKAVWSFSTPLGERTVVSGILGYNKAVNTNRGQQGVNSFEPQTVLVHKFSGRVAGYLDYDTYEDFNAEQFGQTLKAGVTFGLDRQLRWSLSPYGQFPLNQFTSSTNIKSDVGAELSFRY
jgi:hypothetical protein